MQGQGRAQRWPEWFFLTPLWPCREAQGVGRARSEACPASCSDSLRLFERSAAGAKRVSQRRPTPEHRRLPRSEAEGHGQWARPFVFA